MTATREAKKEPKSFSFSHLLGEKRPREVIGPLLALCFMLYFLYHIFQGERGLLSWLRLQQKIVDDEKVLLSLQSQREILEHKVYLLRPDSLDKDMLEERVRLLLNFGRADEVVIHDEGTDVVKKK
ncbi:MAG: septum formation initiator family protein [Alphaproteobacteria bacterium]|jgi:cell division protein FtsB|nr:septum formation initiator family protein [Alphaproteobacteria bacterium]